MAKESVWFHTLKKLDSKYFKVQKITNLEEAAYALSTWFYDNEKKSCLRKMLELPEELWFAALQNWRDHRHDT